MPTSITIPKNPVYPSSMDWLRLRREGIRHIERLGSAVWTDYNLHDPGITILEVLCYALTDLGYRVNLPTNDLFAGTANNFHTAAKVLPNAPVTALDLRKILVDIPGVRNAWVEQASTPEVRFSLSGAFDKEKFQSQLAKYLELLDTTELTLPELSLTDIQVALLTQLNKCTKEKEKIALHKTLLDSWKTQLETITEDTQKALLLYSLDNYWGEVVFYIEEEIRTTTFSSPSLSEREERLILCELLKIKNQDLAYDFTSIIEGTDATLLTLIDKYSNLQDILYKHPFLCLYLANSVQFSTYDKEATDYQLFAPQGIYDISLKLEEEAMVNAQDIKEEALRRLHQQRNIAEDFNPDIRILEKEDMGIHLSIKVNPATDELAVLAKVHHAIAEYLSPSIRFYSLEEMLQKYAVFYLNEASLLQLEDAFIPSEVIDLLKAFQDQEFIGIQAFTQLLTTHLSPTQLEEYASTILIHSQKRYDSHPVYQGPLLDHGFIDEQELLSAQARQTIYRSDLYQLIAAIEGVEEIKALRIFKCEEEDENTNNIQWCLKFDCRCLPELDLDCSTFSVDKGGGAITIPIRLLEDHLDSHPALTTKINRQGQLDLAVPTGKNHQDLTEFTSIQEDFPRTYKIGRTGISSNEEDARLAQAKQLQGYLLFYDQIFSNYLSHLASVHSILAMEKDNPLTYQPLYDIPGIKNLLLDYTGSTDADWDNFKSNDNNAYLQALDRLVAGSATKKGLKTNKVLDHLLARFGEQFTDYVLNLYQIEAPVQEQDLQKGNLKDWQADKQRFLKNIPTLGSNRARGFQYYSDAQNQTPFWNSDNVAGLKNRVCAKLGIDDWTRHTITCEPNFVVEVGQIRSLSSGSNRSKKYHFYVKNSTDDNEKTLLSTARFSNLNTAKMARNDFLNVASNAQNYGILEEEDRIGFWVNIPKEDRTIENALLLERAESSGSSAQRLESLLEMAAAQCQDDNFHIVEHLLLRPRNETFTENLNPITCCLDCLELLDPYSFWISIIVPDWVERFKEPSQWNYFQQTIRQETPAHLAVQFYHLNREQMLAFETHYYQWLQALTEPKQSNLAKTNDRLVKWLNEIN